jgi:hypothetical protein
MLHADAQNYSILSDNAAPALLPARGNRLPAHSADGGKSLTLRRR